jgi:hypothetical protein
MPWKKIWKLHKYMVRNFQNTRQVKADNNMVESNSPNAPSTLPPHLCFPAELAFILLLAFSLFAVFAALSQRLCSESPHLSIKLHYIYAC